MAEKKTPCGPDKPRRSGVHAHQPSVRHLLFKQHFLGDLKWSGTKNVLARVVTVVVFCILLFLSPYLLDYLLTTPFGPYESELNGAHLSSNNNLGLASTLVIPLVLGIGAWWLETSERKVDRQLAEERAKTDHEIAEKRAQTDHEIAKNEPRPTERSPSTANGKLPLKPTTTAWPSYSYLKEKLRESSTQR